MFGKLGMYYLVKYVKTYLYSRNIPSVFFLQIAKAAQIVDVCLIAGLF